MSADTGFFIVGGAGGAMVEGSWPQGPQHQPAGGQCIWSGHFPAPLSVPGEAPSLCRFCIKPKVLENLDNGLHGFNYPGRADENYK